MKKIILFIFIVLMVNNYIISHEEEKEESHKEDREEDHDNDRDKRSQFIIFEENDEFSEIVIEMKNWSFSMDKIILDKDKNYRLTFITKIGHHGVAIPKLKMSSKNLTVGESISFDFKGILQGSYEFNCNIFCGSGHKKMKGVIQIK
ncbi:MAG: cupredoxin domain-containing protein [Spirochaetaceae bacterium]